MFYTVSAVNIAAFMKTDNIIIAHPQTDEQVNAIKAFMTALKIKFEISKSDNETYNPEFVNKILESKQQYEQGRFSSVNNEEELKTFLGLD